MLGWLCCLFPSVRKALTIVWQNRSCAGIARASSHTSAGNQAAEQDALPLYADVRQLIREMSIADPLRGHPGFMTNCSSSVSMSGKQRRKIYGTKARIPDPKDGSRLLAMMRMASLQWTYSSCRPSRSGYCTVS